jgi:succinate dehydrogenase hydrophobic anchor subunit
MPEPLEIPRGFLGRPPGALPGFVPPSGDESLPEVRRLGAVRAGRLWLMQAVTGALLVVFLGIHLVAQHFLAPGGLRDYAAVVDYLRQPLALVAEVLLLVTVIVHAALGMRVTLVETIRRPVVVRRLSLVVALVGFAAIVYALWLTVIVIAGPG